MAQAGLVEKATHKVKIHKVPWLAQQQDKSRNDGNL
jgi:hypothetical protein